MMTITVMISSDEWRSLHAVHCKLYFGIVLCPATLQESCYWTYDSMVA